MLNESFDYDVKPLALSQLVRRGIAPQMGKFDTAGRLLMQFWYVDYALAACRRITGRGEDEISVYRALNTLLDVADDLNVEALFEHHRALGNADDDYPHDRPLMAQSIRVVVEGARPGEEAPSADVVGRATVEADLRRLHEVASDAAELATRRTAHRLTAERIEERGGDFTVTVEEIDELVEAVSQIYARWALLLRRVDVDASVAHLNPGQKLEQALRLYDRDAITQAVLAQNRATIAAGGSPASARDLETYVGVGYVVEA